MKNSDENAFPYRSTSFSETEDNNYGLTKREYFAIKCLHGLLAANPKCLHGNNIDLPLAEAVSIHAVFYADQLLKKLEETQ